MGNRDLNKVRLTSELSEGDMKRDIEEIPKPFWDRNAISLREYLEGIREKKASGDGDNCVGDLSLDKLNTRAERLRYMLKHTLGCPDTFEFRREEVHILTQIYGDYPPKLETHDYTPIGGDSFGAKSMTQNIEVTDEQVVDSFLYEMSEEGSLRQYLHLSQIAATVGSEYRFIFPCSYLFFFLSPLYAHIHFSMHLNCNIKMLSQDTIFVHGAIDRLTMKYVPSFDTKFQIPTHPPPPFNEPHTVAPTDGRIVENVYEWVQSLNEYLQHGLKDFVNQPEWNGERTSRGGEGV